MDTKKSQADAPEEQTESKKAPPPAASGDAPADQSSSGTEPSVTGMSPHTIQFSKKQQAQLVMPPADTPAADIVSALGLAQPRTVLLMIGTGNDLPKAMAPYLTQLFSRSVARAIPSAFLEIARIAG